jgi:transposase
MRSEEKRQEERGQQNPKAKKKKARRGRVKTADKIAKAERIEPVYPEGAQPKDCYPSHVRTVWRLEKDRAVLIAYEIHRDAKGRYGKIPGVLGRGEFGMEFLVEIGYLVYFMGLSIDKCCHLLAFFQNLCLRKAQADALLNQLSRHWEREFDTLCTLLANSLVVHADETGWSLNSVWAFLSEKARVLFFGVHKDAATLKEILDPASFSGLVFSDDAAVYEDFTQSQKCWAHLLRKAIKLTLQDPSNAAYRALLDQLLAIYKEARRVQCDGRLGDAGRARKVVDLGNKVFDLCARMWGEDPPDPPAAGPAKDYCLLIQEVSRMMMAGELFQFVTVKAPEQPNGQTKPVDGTNNESERTLRNPAQARDTGRANKKTKGARRQSIITSVLESLRLYLQKFTLSSVLDEMKRWWATGKSCFTKLLKKMKLALPEGSILDKVLPKPDEQPLPIPSG